MVGWGRGAERDVLGVGGAGYGGEVCVCDVGEGRGRRAGGLLAGARKMEMVYDGQHKSFHPSKKSVTFLILRAGALSERSLRLF